MKNRNELKGKKNKTKGKLKQNLSMTKNDDASLPNGKQNDELPRSPLSIIVSRLIAESKQNEMSGSLQFKLGKTSEEIDKLISEL